MLIPDTESDALGLVKDTLAKHGISADTRAAAASLEDVFVAVTLKPEKRAA